MSTKIALLKSGESVIADIKELISEPPQTDLSLMNDEEIIDDFRNRLVLDAPHGVFEFFTSIEIYDIS